MTPEILALARLEGVNLVDRVPVGAGRARTITPAGIEASVALEGIVDVDAERKRIRKEISGTDAEAERARRKLADDNFLSKAPSAVVAKEQRKLEESLAKKEKLEAQLRAFGG